MRVYFCLFVDTCAFLRVRGRWREGNLQANGYLLSACGLLNTFLSGLLLASVVIFSLTWERQNPPQKKVKKEKENIHKNKRMDR